MIPYSTEARAWGPNDEVLLIDDEDIVDVADDEDDAPLSTLDFEKLHDDAC